MQNGCPSGGIGIRGRLRTCARKGVEVQVLSGALFDRTSGCGQPQPLFSCGSRILPTGGGMNTYRLGIIGAGMWGKVLAGCFRQDPRARVTWINSASEETTRAAAQEFGVERWTLDYREILACLLYTSPSPRD